MPQKREDIGPSVYMTPWVIRLLVANVAVFFVTGAMPSVARALAFVPALAHLRPWTAVTYMFVHANVMHLLLNMIILFFFGPRLEDRLGVRSFLILYFVSGLGGALFSFLFEPRAAVVGASGAMYGLLFGFAYFWPREHIYIWGILPVQARWLVLAFLVITLYSGMSGSQGGIAHFAHLGGIVTGFGYLWQRQWRQKRKRQRWRDQVLDVPRRKTRADRGRAVERWKAIPVDSLHELNRGEVRSLLQKVEAEGADSLSPEERAFLDRIADMSSTQP